MHHTKNLKPLITHALKGKGGDLDYPGEGLPNVGSVAKVTASEGLFWAVDVPIFYGIESPQRVYFKRDD